MHDRLGEVLDGIFDLKVDKNETTSSYTGKARAAFSAAEAEGVKFPSVAKGYLLLRFAQRRRQRSWQRHGNPTRRLTSLQLSGQHIQKVFMSDKAIQ